MTGKLNESFVGSLALGKRLRVSLKNKHDLPENNILNLKGLNLHCVCQIY